jgi:pyroglutamyl-peptidase
MTAKKILLTSFDTWMPHQKSNASDDLLAQISPRDFWPDALIFLRKLPVNETLASKQAIAKIQEVQPDVVICCGMAEGREILTVESQAFSLQDCLKTIVDLNQLVAGLPNTAISHDAGQFVCEALYYSVLNYLNSFSQPQIPCIFVHVPILHPDNMEAIAADFSAIVHRLGSSPNLTANIIPTLD